MKKSLLLTLFAAGLMLVGVNASAQISFGAGPATRLYFEKGKNVNYTYGVQMCFEDSRRMTDYFGYSAGLDFGTYGKNDFFSAAEGLSEVYVDIPVRMKFYIPVSDDFQLYFFGGVAPSVCVSSNVKTENGKTSRFGEGGNYSRYDVLAGGGIGMEVGERFKFTFGYDHGIMDRDKTETGVMRVGAAKVGVAFMFY